MSNETLIAMIKTAELKAENLQPDGTTYYAEVDSYDGCDPYQLLIITDGNGNRVGGFLYMMEDEAHIVAIPEYRGNGYMSRFARSGIVRKVFPECKKVSIMTDFENEPEEISKRIHLAKLIGFEITNREELLWYLRFPDVTYRDEDYLRREGEG